MRSYMLHSLTRICQFLTILPFSYDFEKKQFKKSKILYLYNIFLSSSLIFITCFVQIAFIVKFKFYDPKIIDLVNFICIHILKVFGTLFTFLIGYQKIFQSDKFLEIFNIVLDVLKETQVMISINKILLTIIIEFIVYPILVAVTAANHIHMTPILLIVNACVVLCVTALAKGFLLPVTLAYKILLMSMRETNAEIRSYFVNSKPNNNLEMKLNQIQVNYCKRISYINKIHQCYSMNLLINLILASFDLVRRIFEISYRIWFIGIQLDFHNINVFAEFILHIIFIVHTFIGLFEIPNKMKQEESKMNKIIRNVPCMFRNKEIIKIVHYLLILGYN